MTTNTTITIRWRAAGYHSWPDAHAGRMYLAQAHRHVFHFEVELGVLHDERDVEFHDLLDECRLIVPDGFDYGASSCEAIARRIHHHLTNAYPDRSVRVSVFEDGENGATIR